MAEEVKLCRGISDYNEITEKAFEGLMFLSGVPYRPDIAFEIALAVRKRNWSLSLRTKLSEAYSRGYSRRGKRKTFDILSKGLEKSVEAELGVLFKHETKK